MRPILFEVNMKLKVFTMEETKQLIDDLNKYWKLCAEVTSIARFRITEGFESHVRDYKWDWRATFTRRVKSVEDMTYKICGGQFRSTYYEFMESKGFSEYLSCWFGDSDPKYYFVQKPYNDIVEAAARIGYWKQEHIATFHELLELYAEHPLVPEDKDIEIIKTVRSRLEILEHMMEEYNNAI